MKLSDEKITLIAMTCHEINKLFCEMHGDLSQPDWEDAPQWQRDSAIKGVLYHNTHPESQPEDSHKSWMKVKLEEGWKYGPVKDPDKKEHPCMVPFEKLPHFQQAKDVIFTAVAKSFLEK